MIWSAATCRRFCSRVTPYESGDKSPHSKRTAISPQLFTNLLQVRFLLRQSQARGLLLETGAELDDRKQVPIGIGFVFLSFANFFRVNRSRVLQSRILCETVDQFAKPDQGGNHLFA